MKFSIIVASSNSLTIAMNPSYFWSHDKAISYISSCWLLAVHIPAMIFPFSLGAASQRFAA